VDPNKERPQYTPTSVLSLGYERKWSEDGTLSLRINRTNMPQTLSDVKDSYEGRLRFDCHF
jgi:hypothetical protein